MAKSNKTKGKAKPSDEIIGLNIKSYRSEKNMTQEDLAQALGITFQQVQKYENGSNRVSASTLLNISEVVNVPVEDFFEGVKKGKGKRGPPFKFTNQHLKLISLFETLPDEKSKKSFLAFLETASKR